MNFIHPTIAEQDQWDLLVKENQGTVFSESRYLDALDLKWLILYNEDRTGGMVCPYAVKAGKRILTNPIYHQYAEWIGEGTLDEGVVQILLEKFEVSEFNVVGVVANGIERVHQVIESNDFKINSLAKRSLKKSFNYTISLNKEISLITQLRGQGVELPAEFRRPGAGRIARLPARSLLRQPEPRLHQRGPVRRHERLPGSWLSPAGRAGGRGGG